MKQKEITTGKATIVVVDAPHGNIPHSNLLYFPDGSWSHLGPLSKITEDQWKDIVDQSLHTGLHPHYVNGINPPNAYCYQNATESGLSLLRANGVVLENLLGEEPTLSDYIFEEHPELVGNPKEYDHDKFEYDHSYWAKAQSEVWTNPYIFLKVK